MNKNLLIAASAIGIACIAAYEIRRRNNLLEQSLALRTREAKRQWLAQALRWIILIASASYHPHS